MKIFVATMLLVAGVARADVIGRIDALDVEAHWPAGVHVDWRTGAPDGRPALGDGKHTHCSAFVAAAADAVGIYVLRPPAHSARFLASAQADWLATQPDWRRLRDGTEAQQRANQGDLVVAVYRSHRVDKPGHIAIVRPSDKSAAALVSEGPQITQAGGTNYRSTTVKQGFSGHPKAFAAGEIAYYAHAVVAK